MTTLRCAVVGTTCSFLLSLAGAQTEDTRLLATACNRFAADLHGKLAARGAPTASPGSIALALLMLVPGARNETAKELLALLHLPDELHGERLYAAARQLVDGIAIAKKGKGNDGPQLRIANDLWAQTGYPIRIEYSNELRTSFGAAAHDLPFRTDPDGSREKINAHIAQLTNQRIPRLLTPDLVSPATRVVLTNAIWLKAAWLHTFHDGGTKPGPFTLASGEAVQVPTMHLEESFVYAETDDWQCVVLPFADCDLVAEFVLPRAGKSLADAELALLAGSHDKLLVGERVRVHLPKFRIAGAHRLREPLIALGMCSAFDAAVADFTGITPRRELVVDDVVHQTWIEVDEDGAEAAAATAGVMKAGAAMPPKAPKVFAAERPFAFTLRDRSTGLVLFVGRVDDPRVNPTGAKPAR